MTHNRTSIQDVVMKRVRNVHRVRPFVSTSALAVYLVAISLLGLAREVFVAQVFYNAPHTINILKIGEFFISAFTHTSLGVQLLTMIVVFGGLITTREIYTALTGEGNKNHTITSRFA